MSRLFALDESFFLLSVLRETNDFGGGMSGKQLAAVAAASAGLLSSGCAMTVDSQQSARFLQDGYDVLVETRVKRDAVMLLDDAGDSSEVWGVNRGAEPVCLGFASGGGSVDWYWRLAPQSEQRIFARRVLGGDWVLKRPTATNTDCSNWR